MTTWAHYEPILDNLLQIIKYQVTALAEQTYSFVMPCLAAQDDPTKVDIAKVIMGTKAYNDMDFPLCCIVVRDFPRDTVTSGTELHNVNTEIYCLEQDDASFYGGSKKALKLACDVSDAVYASMNSKKTRTLGDACHDIFVKNIQRFDDERLNKDIHCFYLSVTARKRF